MNFLDMHIHDGFDSKDIRIESKYECKTCNMALWFGLLAYGNHEHGAFVVGMR